jgi:phage I-like protein
MIKMSKNELEEIEGMELPVGLPPEWLELIPAGEVVKGRDGRTWINPFPESILTAFNAKGCDLVIDFEHSTELKAPYGEPAPAVGWVDSLRLKGSAVLGRVAWNHIGKAAVLSRSYRYYSPVFQYEKSTGRIVSLSSVGLTNQPNLRLPALNNENMRAYSGKAPLEFSEEQLKIARLLGNTLEDIAKYGMESAATQSTGLSVEEAKIAWLLGVTAEDIKKYGGR